MDVIPGILALARLGATGRAWEAFIEAGLDAVSTDAKVLTLKGRLLKEKARAARNGTQSRLFRASARAYAEAAALNPDSYPLINAATMSLFAGEPDHMRIFANEVLVLIQTGVGRGETAYWHAATRAEALLLTGNTDSAIESLALAIAQAPNAWEDHATTLRQFRHILAFRHEDAVWLKNFAPPPSLYFNGIMGLAANDPKATMAIRAKVREIGAGFGYGALAAGADILIAEALLADGAEIHIILPVIPSIFKLMSVEPFGGEWIERFDAVIERAASIEIVDGGSDLSFAAIEVAEQVAKGRAIDNARRMESSAVGLMVLAPETAFAAEAGSYILELEPTAETGTAPPLANSELSILIQYGQDFSQLMQLADVQSARKELTKIRRKNADASIAVSLGVGTGMSDARQTLMRRMLSVAEPGTTIANVDAAMAFKAHNPEMWIEPLGELPETGGATSLYALAMI